VCVCVCGRGVAQIMYTHVSKYKNNKIEKKEVAGLLMVVHNCNPSFL
jgi:hypothetical protein